MHTKLFFLFSNYRLWSPSNEEKYCKKKQVNRFTRFVLVEIFFFVMYIIWIYFFSCTCFGESEFKVEKFGLIFRRIVWYTEGCHNRLLIIMLLVSFTEIFSTYRVLIVPFSIQSGSQNSRTIRLGNVAYCCRDFSHTTPLTL